VVDPVEAEPQAAAIVSAAAELAVRCLEELAGLGWVLRCHMLAAGEVADPSEQPPPLLADYYQD
jgi:hypothetical protein